MAIRCGYTEPFLPKNHKNLHPGSISSPEYAMEHVPARLHIAPGAHVTMKHAHALTAGQSGAVHISGHMVATHIPETAASHPGHFAVHNHH